MKGLLEGKEGREGRERRQEGKREGYCTRVKGKGGRRVGSCNGGKEERRIRKKYGKAKNVKECPNIIHHGAASPCITDTGLCTIASSA